MSSSCVSVLLFSLLITSTLGARHLEVEKNPGCQPGECETLDIMYATSVESQDQLIFISSTDGSNMGALVTESGNITMNYTQILKDQCDGVFQYEDPKPKNSIGLVFESFPTSEEELTWKSAEHKCEDKDCVIGFSGVGKEQDTIDIKAQITAEPYKYPEFPDNDLSPKTLHVQIEMKNIKIEDLKTKNITMYIIGPATDKYSSFSSEKIGLMTFESTDDDSGHPFKMIDTSAEFIAWKPAAIKVDKSTLPVNTTDPQDVTSTVDLKKLNLPVACFFHDQKGSKVYQIQASFDMKETPTNEDTISLLWSVSIGLGNPSSSGSPATSHALRNWLIVGGIASLLGVLGGVLYCKSKRRGYNSSV